MSSPNFDEHVELLMSGTTFADEVGIESHETSLRSQMATELKAALIRAHEQNRPLRVYQGFDPTASSLHLGHMVPALKLRQFQELGHQVIFLIGDYTAMIGDPSGQSSERKQLTHEETTAHAENYTSQAFRLLDPDKTEVRRNSEWLSKLSFAEIVGLASMFPLKQIISRRDFQQRLERGDSLRFHECLYSLMQGYDAYALECDVQVAAYDQHFNLLAGRNIQQHFGQKPHVMMTVPLLMGTDGRKMSKSYGNAVMLSDKSADIYGKSMRISDELLPQYLQLATTLPQDEKNGYLKQLEEQSVNPKDVKKAVAYNIVAQYFGEKDAQAAEEIFKQLSERREVPENVPTETIDVGSDGLWLPKALAQLKMVKSSSEGRRMIKQGAVSLDGVKVSDMDFKLEAGKEVLVKVGKRRYLQLKTR